MPLYGSDTNFFQDRFAALDTSVTVSSARDELIRGVRALLDRPMTPAASATDAAVVIGTAEEIRRVLPSAAVPTLTRVRIEATPDKDEFALVDYIEIVPRS